MKKSSGIDEIHNRLETLTSRSNLVERNRLLGQLAQLYYEEGKLDSAKHYFRNAISGCRKMKKQDTVQLSNLYAGLGRIYWENQQWDNAISSLDSAQLWNSLNVQAYNLKGVTYQGQNLYREALEQFHHALQLAKQQHEDTLVNVLLSNMGNVNGLLGNYEEGMNYLSQSYEMAQLLHDSVSQAHIKQYKGVILKRQGKYEEALRAYKEANYLFEKLKYFNKVTEILTNTGNIYFEQGNFRKAIQYYLQSLKKAHDLGNNFVVINNYSSISVAYSELGEARNCILYADSTIQLSKAIHNPLYEMDARQTLSFFYSKINNHKAAFENHVRYTEIKDSLNEKERNAEAREFELRYQAKQKQEEIDKLNYEKNLVALQYKNERQQYWIFTGSIVFIILLSLMALYVFNRRKLQQKDQELQRLASRIEETRQVALRSQMNPHFIFNCITLVDSLVWNNERKRASELLTSFANLVRQVLEYSERDMITLKEEIQYLTEYLRIEQLRYNNAFEFSIQESDNYDFELPPLLLQPFVENAILHGLRLSDRSEKWIKIITHVENERRLIIHIIDNGIGRTQSAQINESINREHKSMGMRITQERMELLRTVEKINAEVNIIDLYDEMNFPKGTEVRVEFVLQDQN